MRSVETRASGCKGDTNNEPYTEIYEPAGFTSRQSVEQNEERGGSVEGEDRKRKRKVKNIPARQGSTSRLRCMLVDLHN